MIPYNALPYVQQYTRTQFERGLPSDWCKRSTEELDAIINDNIGQLEEAIAFEYQGYNKKYELLDELSTTERNRLDSLKVCTAVNRVLLNALMPTVPHLSKAEVDIEPRHEAFWCVGGIEPTPTVKKQRKKKKMTDEEINESYDRTFQYEGKPLLALRNRLPLEPIIEDMSAPAFTTEDLPQSPCDPRAVGWESDYQHGRSIPGFWPGSEHKFGQLSYHARSHFVRRDKNFGRDDEQNALHSQAILSSFSWLLAQACYQGFSTYNDITYPLTTQTIITDGKYWSFYAYQLNTTTLHSNAYNTNPKVNKCWGTDELKLFDEISGDGKLLGLNAYVLRQLIQFYLAVPKKRDHEMAPYLNPEESIVADIEHVERRKFLETKYKYLNSKRRRTRLLPEVYLWEKIYKIDNETRPMDARRRPFELNKDPWARRLDDHAPTYIPKKHRPYPKCSKKFEDVYWP